MPNSANDVDALDVQLGSLVRAFASQQVGRVDVSSLAAKRRFTTSVLSFDSGGGPRTGVVWPRRRF